jgi:hypothetical protein
MELLDVEDLTFGVQPGVYLPPGVCENVLHPSKRNTGTT